MEINIFNKESFQPWYISLNKITFRSREGLQQFKGEYLQPPIPSICEIAPIKVPPP